MRGRFLVGALLALVLGGTVAFANLVQFKVASGGSTTAWNPSDKSAGTTLSTTTVTNDTELSTGSAVIDGVRSTVSYTGKVYVEFNTLIRTQTTFIGFCNSSSLVGVVICGSGDANGLVFNLTNSLLSWNSGLNGNGGLCGVAPGAGDTIAMAYDIPNSNFWVRCHLSGTWTNWNYGGADPSAGTNPLSISPNTPTGPFFLYAGNPAANQGDKMQIVCSGFLGTLPTGFSAC